MYRISNIYKTALIIMTILLFASCTRFDNPVELEPEGETVTSGTVTVSVSGIAREATILVVDLYWTEEGASGENRWRKTMALTGKFAELFPDFHGLGPGIGYAIASTYVGTIMYQQPITSQNIQLGEGKTTTVYLTLPEADGDIDLDFDFTPQDGDIDNNTTDGDKDDTQTDGDVTDSPENDDEIISRNTVYVNYSETESDMNGQLNKKDNGSSWDEWNLAYTQKVLTDHEDGADVYFMQNGSVIQVGMRITTYSADPNADRVGLAFDPDMNKEGDEFVLYVQRQSNIKNCIPISANSCDLISGMPENQPDWDSKQTQLSDGWEVEIEIDFKGLFITSGTPKSLGFAIIVQNNNVEYLWPLGTNSKEPDKWGKMASEDNWSIVTIDGDDEQDADQDVDIDNTQPDGDDDLDQQEEDNSETEEVEAESEMACTPYETYCELQGSVWHAILCGANGQPSSDEACNQTSQCKTHLCNSSGCYFDLKSGDQCDDGFVCTQNDQCVGGECKGDTITCQTYECKIKLDPTETECCVYDDAPNGKACGISTECNHPQCSDGECQPNFIEGCCPGHPDMLRIQTTYNEETMDFCIDKYEAIVVDTVFYDNGCLTTSNGTRYGETADDYPLDWPDDVDDTTPRVLKACNNEGHIPSRFLTYRQAEKACIESGKRICTNEEFLIACASNSFESYPYGNVYNASTCNGSGGPVSTSGNYADCQRDGVYDLSGNLSEWSKSGAVSPKSCGGNINSDQAGLGCLTSCNTIDEATNNELLGFRCCVYGPQK